MVIKDHEYYVDLDVAKLLRDAGFDWECREHYYPNFITCQYEEYAKPTIEVVQRWLREVKNIAVYVCPVYEPVNFAATNDEIWLMKWQVNAVHYDIESDKIDLGNVKEKTFPTFEEALDASIKKILEIILNK